MNIFEIEQTSNEVLSLFQMRPIPKKTWRLWEKLTLHTTNRPRGFHSYFVQWVAAFPSHLTREDVAGVDPHRWIYLHTEWVTKAGQKWVDVPLSMQKSLLQAQTWALGWVNAQEKRENDTLMYGCWIPTVEQVGEVETEYHGRLRFIETKLSGWVPHGEGRLVMERAEGNQVAEVQVFRELRTLISNKVEALEGWKGEPDGLIRFRDESGIHSGKSLALGCYGSVLVTLYRDCFESPRHIAFRGDSVAYTGELDSEGWLKPVDETGLEAKINACFYSWINTIVVPMAQAPQCRAYVEGLQKQWPKKRLHIIGMERAEQLLENRNLTQVDQDSPLLYRAKWLWRRKNSWLGWGSVAVLALVLLRIWYGPLDKNPSYLESNGEEHLVFNSSGQVLRTFRDRVDNNTRQTYYYSPVLSLFDIDKDEVNELLFVGESVKDSGYRKKPKIALYRSTRKEPIWEFEPELKVEYPRIMGSKSGSSIALGARGYHREDGGISIFVILNTFEGFNTVVQEIDFESKTVRQNYVHPGLIHTLELRDITGDGKEELLLGGMSNALFAGVFIVLDPTEFDGNAITSGDYISDYPKKAKERAYILLPNTELAHAITYKKYTEVSVYPKGWSHTNFNEIKLRVIDYRDYRTKQNPNGLVHYLLKLNKKLEVVDLLTSDVYDVKAKEAVDEGLLEELPSYDYWQEYMQTKIQHWDGKKWQPGGGWVKWE